MGVGAFLESIFSAGDGDDRGCRTDGAGETIVERAAGGEELFGIFSFFWVKSVFQKDCLGFTEVGVVRAVVRIDDEVESAGDGLAAETG